MPVPKTQNRAFGELVFGADVEAVLIFPLQRDAVLHGVPANQTVDDRIGAVRHLAVPGTGERFGGLGVPALRQFLR
jgi:hypothetical protein